MRTKLRTALIPTALLASACGARTSSGIAAVFPSRATKLWALGELVFDKLPNIPDRIDARLLAGRIVAGAFVGAVVGGRAGTGRAESAIAGALTALASAHVSYRMRRALSRLLPPTAAGLVEDAFVLTGAAAGASMLQSRRHP